MSHAPVPTSARTLVPARAPAPRAPVPLASRGPVPAADLDAVLLASQDRLQRLRGARVLVASGADPVAQWLVASLCHANDRLGLGARLAVLGPAAAPEPYAGRKDVTLLRCGPAGAVPAAGRVGSVDAVLYLPDTGPGLAAVVAATEGVLGIAARSGAVPTLLLSSAAVYGPQPAYLSHLTETYDGAPDPLARGSEHAGSLRAAETLCGTAVAGGARVPVARRFGALGPVLTPMPRLVAQGAAGPAVASYLYASDLVTWLWAVLLDGRSGSAYNVGSELAVPALELVSLVRAAVTGAGPPTLPVTSDQAQLSGSAGELPSRSVPSTARARAELGVEQTVELSEAIRRTVLAPALGCTAG